MGQKDQWHKLAGLVLVSGVWLSWSAVCPCERTPGGVLFGSVESGQITDWSFANDVPLCQIQVGRIPYSINLNCMATETGELYLSCSQCAQKRWAGIALDIPNVRLRLNGTVYRVEATRVLEADALDQAWRARVEKLQVHGGSAVNPTPPPDAVRPGHWWSFHLTSR